MCITSKSWSNNGNRFVNNWLAYVIGFIVIDIYLGKKSYQITIISICRHELHCLTVALNILFVSISLIFHIQKDYAAITDSNAYNMKSTTKQAPHRSSGQITNKAFKINASCMFVMRG